ncbi:MFS transporter [Micrococcoides hystricis]|uniref:CynX/NimT family MFS transporter n=1 Tax=Micrococcoides hystricis TaxID=1572761 RepID=A0ABV6PC92_9MICC
MDGQQQLKAHPATWWVVLAAGVIAAGHVWKVPAALEFIRSELGMDLVASGTFLGIVQVAGMLVGLPMALYAEIIGLRKGIIIGLGLLAAGSIAGAAAPNVSFLMASRAVEGLGFVMVTMVAPQLIRMVTEGKKINLAMGIWGAYQGFANLVAVLATAAAMSVMDWRAWWAVFAGLAILPMPWLLKWVPKDVVPADQSRSQIIAAAGKRTVRTIKTAPPWIAGVAFACYTMMWGALIGFMPTVLQEEGFSASAAGVWGALIGGVNIIGAVASGPLLERGIPLRALLIPTFVVMGAMSYIAFGLDVPIAVRIGAVMLFSAVGSLIPASLMRLAVELAPQGGSTSAVVGLMQQIFNGGNFIGPVIMAVLAQMTSGWDATWWFTAAASVLGIALALTLREERLGVRLRSS